ncbi:MAG TPA: hypothetical protein VEH29_03745, partial [Acidimicrobiales bacterium]|nr:hypothetical protein [Acidimicrobiales bacterium]
MRAHDDGRPAGAARRPVRRAAGQQSDPSDTQLVAGLRPAALLSLQRAAGNASTTAQLRGHHSPDVLQRQGGSVIDMPPELVLSLGPGVTPAF